MRAGASACFRRLSWCYYLRSVLLYPRCGLEICGKKRREAAGVFMRLPTGLGAPPFVHGRQTWYNDCAERNPARQDRAAPLRGDCTGKLRLEKKMSPEAPLSSRRTQYNDCAERNPARRGGPPRCAGIVPANCGLRRKCRLRRRFLPGARSTMIARSAIRPDRIGPPRVKTYL